MTTDASQPIQKPSAALWSVRRDPARRTPSTPFDADALAVIDLDAGDPWPDYHPGPLDIRHGSREHTVRVRFTLAAEAPEQCRLTLSFHASSGPCPDLELRLGEHHGLIRPEVHRPRRDAVMGTGPTAGDAVVVFDLPGSWLHAGPNELDIVTTLDGERAPTDPADYHHAYDAFGSGIRWMSAELAAGRTPPRPATALATPFFVPDGAGLAELVEVTVTVPPGDALPVSVVLRAGGNDHDIALRRGNRDFGEFRGHVAVPEFDAALEAMIEVDGQQYPSTLTPFRKWTMHLVPHVHLDVGYTDYQGKVLELHSRNLDRAVAVQESNPDFRFSADGALIVQQFLQTRRPEQVERVLDAVRDGRIGVNAFHSLFLSGLPTLEDCYRFAYAAADLRADYGVRADYANLTDVPSYSSAIPSVLAALDIHRFVGIENHGRGVNADSDTAHLVSPVWWRGPDGARVLTYFSDQYSQLRHMVGDPQTQAGAERAFTDFLTRYERPDYAPTDIPIVGSHCDNEDLAAGDIFLVERWNSAYAYPRLRISTFSDYFDAVEPLGDALGEWRGDGGSYWEDGVGTAATAMVSYRRAQQLMPLAENLAALVGLHGAVTTPNAAELERGWEGVRIGAEHTWTWSHAYSHPHAEQTHDQEAWKRHRIDAGLRVGVDETRRAMSQLAEVVTTDGPAIVVYNGLSWARDVSAELDLPDERVPDGAAVETLSSERGVDRVRLQVADVPAFGYRVLPLREGRAPEVEAWQPLGDGLDTERWTVGTDARGRITSLTHRPTGRELLSTAGPYALGEVLYVHAGTADDRFTMDSTFEAFPSLPGPDLSIEPAALRWLGARRTPTGWRLAATGSAPTMSDVHVDVLLRDTCDTVEVLVEFDKQRALARESVYVVFPFAGHDPQFHWDRQQGWVDPRVDHSIGACNEWFTVQNAVCLDAPSGSVVWTSADAPLFTVGDVVRGTWATQFGERDGTVMSWVMNNYWPTNTPPSQEGHVSLRYAFAPTDSFDPVRASRFGRAYRAPAAVSELTWLDKDDTDARALPAATGTLFDPGTPEHVAVSVFAARREPGLVVRVANLSGEAGDVGLSSPFGTGSGARFCTADERPIGPASLDAEGRLQIGLKPYAVVSLLFSAT